MKQTIYKKDTKGKVRYLTITNEGRDIVQISGVLGTYNPVEHRKEAKPKNIGRSNETTAEEQALKECYAIITDKLTKGYFKTKEEAETEEIILPMLAKVYFDEEKKISEDEILIGNIKLDGIRLLIDIDPDKNLVKLTSRQGKELTTVPHIYNEALRLLEVFKDNEAGRVILDGELYAGTDYTFQECMSLIKKEQPGQEVLKYVIYDVIDLEQDSVYKDRVKWLTSFFNTKVNGFYPESVNIFTVCPFKYINKRQVKTMFQEATSQGYEGLMVKRLNGEYKINGRSSDLLKYKEFFDLPLTIVDVLPTDAKPDHGTVVVDFKGERVGCGMKVSHEERKNILTNKKDYIGKTAEVRFFEYTDEGSLRFPIYHGLKY